jgi:glucose/arabinose dehydrogenase
VTHPTRNLRGRATAALLTVLAFAAAACSSPEPGDATVVITFDAAATTTTAPTADTEPAGTDPSSARTDPPADPATTTPATNAAGPLPVPTIQLFEVGRFDQPVDIAERPFDLRVFVVEQPGRVIAFDDLSIDVVLDISDLTEARGEQGLLGLAFHPERDLAYVNFTDNNGDTVVAEFAFDEETAVFDRDSYREVLTVDQPYRNHNGGELVFGPDGLLYIGLGDGGSGGDPDRVALDLSTPLGKILRIDPVGTGGDPYGVPDDNPFVEVDGADPTIWSVGLRNPWRFSFDPVTGDLWIADVGQNQFEEINRAPGQEGLDAGRGLSFGWSAFEGFERFNEDQPADGHIAPVYVYPHEQGRCSVSGGTLYRGETIADLAGWFVFGDYCTGEIWGLDPTSSVDAPRVVELGRLDTLVAITQGPERELYAISNAGAIARLADAT